MGPHTVPIRCLVIPWKYTHITYLPPSFSEDCFRVNPQALLFFYLYGAPALHVRLATAKTTFLSSSVSSTKVSACGRVALAAIPAQLLLEACEAFGDPRLAAYLLCCVFSQAYSLQPVAGLPTISMNSPPVLLFWLHNPSILRQLS